MSRRQSADYWIEVGDEYLADGKWHDGLLLMEKMWAAITPSVAMRRTEYVRSQSSRTENRTVDVSDNRLVNIGRRSMVLAHIHSRVRSGIFEVQPWPVPRNGWKEGGWQVRDLRVSRMTLPELEARFHVDTLRIRDLIKQEPALEYVMRGRWMYLLTTELPALEERIKRYKLESNRLRGLGPRRHWDRVAQTKPVEISVTQLAMQSEIAPATATMLRLDNPQLPWIEHGKRRHALPLSALPAWNLIVEIHKHGTMPRRVQAMNDARRQIRQTHSPTTESSVRKGIE